MKAMFFWATLALVPAGFGIVQATGSCCDCGNCCGDCSPGACTCSDCQCDCCDDCCGVDRSEAKASCSSGCCSR